MPHAGRADREPNSHFHHTGRRDLLAHALKSRLELTVEHTNHSGHGTELGQAAAADGVDLVVVHGGDGTVSGVVNGLLGHPGAASSGKLGPCPR